MPGPNPTEGELLIIEQLTRIADAAESVAVAVDSNNPQGFGASIKKRLKAIARALDAQQNHGFAKGVVKELRDIAIHSK